MSSLAPALTTPSVYRRPLRERLADVLRPRGPVWTPFNVISVPIILLAAVLLVIRFTYGLGSITNLTQTVPWGLWIGFDVVTGVAFAGGAYVITFMVYILGLEQYRPIVRATVLNGLLAYMFYAGALLLDLGRPWNVINPIIGNEFGLSSVMFLVAWHFMLYMFMEFVEFSPAIAEWLGWPRVKKFLYSMTLGAVILGFTLSALHQAGLGALYLMTKTKIHPLWYSEFLPLLFLVSSVFAGLALVILEGTISRRVFQHRMDDRHRLGHKGIVMSLSRVCAMTMFVYLFLLTLALIHGQEIALLSTGMGAWYLLEVIGLVLVPCILFILAAHRGSMPVAKLAAALALSGIVMNRLNVSIIAFRWDAAVRYVPSWMEIEVTLAVIFVEVWVFRWIVHRLPVLGPTDGSTSSTRTGVEEA